MYTDVNIYQIVHFKCAQIIVQQLFFSVAIKIDMKKDYQWHISLGSSGKQLTLGWPKLCQITVVRALSLGGLP